ncbi:CHAT domain-containing protein [Ornithinimicrobium sufpigmenti]|uniref:CHAT domain-containing protein n=1 Tax=Ornithinimicrobium sufpigmenti TaxID=2508882 RepID=UPI0015E18664|nr:MULTISPECIES: CHAT domain-containing protein [unclassified Ornithinimicrobium]
MQVLDADLLAGEALEAVATQPGTAYIVMVDRLHHPPRLVTMQAGSARKHLTRADPAVPARTALRLDELGAATTLDVLDTADGWRGARPGTVVLRGRSVLGIHIGGGGTRGGGRTVPVEGARKAVPVASGPAEAHASTVGRTGSARSDGDVARFRAFPRVTGPTSAPAGTPFQVEVGFAGEARSAEDRPVIRPNAAALLTFEVQVDGFGFRFPQGMRQPLTIERDDPENATVSFTVVADDVRANIDRSIEVVFSIDGGVVGRAWCDITVLPAGRGKHGDLATDEPAGPSWTAGASGLSTGGGSQIGTADTNQADLTVTILSQQGRPELHWLFQSPHDVARPDYQVETSLPVANAQAFAEQLMAQLPALKGSGLLGNTLRGLGLRVSQVLPIEFWRLLAAVWEKVQAEQANRVPTLMLVTREPFVPWELAWVEGDQHVPAACLPGGRRSDGSVAAEPNQQLGVLWSVGRWIDPEPQSLGPALPVSPPDAVVDATTMAVVVGDYNVTGIADLPAAVEEANHLILSYDAVPVDIEEDQVLRLLNDLLTRGETPYRPAVVHMAAHGKVGLTAQQHTGIVLRDKRVVDPASIEGSKLGRASRPFVFLNACQVGTASIVLSSYGGLASAFLVSGCRGFLAPLWNVDDDVARDISLTFYEQTLDEGIPVGEAVRRIRETFRADTETTASATPMAYVFYGHPNLVLRRPKES